MEDQEIGPRNPIGKCKPEDRSRSEESSTSAENSKPEDRSRTEESSTSAENSKPEDRSKTEESSTSAENSKPEDRSRTEGSSTSAENSKPEDRSKTEESCTSAENSKPEDRSRTEESSTSAENSKADDRSKTEESCTSAENSKPEDRSRTDESSTSIENSKREDRSRTEESSTSTENSKLEDRSKNKESSTSAENSKPEDPSKTEESSTSAESSKPEDRSKTEESSTSARYRRNSEDISNAQDSPKPETCSETECASKTIDSHVSTHHSISEHRAITEENANARDSSKPEDSRSTADSNETTDRIQFDCDNPSAAEPLPSEAATCTTQQQANLPQPVSPRNLIGAGCSHTMSKQPENETLLLGLLSNKQISPQEVLSVVTDAYSRHQEAQGDESDTTDWLPQLKYVKFIRELRKLGQISCLMPVLVWSVKERVPDIGNQTLEQALKLSDVDLLKTLAQSGYNINNYRDTHGTPAVHLAVLKCHVRFLVTMFDIGCDLNQRNIHGQTPFTCHPTSGRDVLMKAVADKKPNIPFILKILQCGVNVNAEDEKGQTALFKACQGGNENKRLVKTLLEQGADAHHRDHDRNTPIIVTCRKNHVDTVEVLCDAGANVNDKNNAGMSPILYAAARQKDVLIKFLLQLGANMGDTDSSGMSPLLIAMKSRFLPTTEMLIRNGALSQEADIFKVIDMIKKSHFPSQYVYLVCEMISDSDLQGSVGPELLTMAVDKNEARAAHVLLKKRTCPNVTLPNGKTLLQVAFEKQHYAIVSVLMKFGAEINFSTASLYDIARWCKLEDLQRKLSVDENPNEQDPNGDTVLHKLVRNMVLPQLETCAPTDLDSRIADVLECLFTAGANPNIQNQLGETPLHVCRCRNICKILLEHGANVDICDNNMRTPLLKLMADAFPERPSVQSISSDIAARIIEILLSYNADVAKVDIHGNDALSVFMAYPWHDVCHETTLNLLIDKQSISSERLTHLLIETFEKTRFGFKVLLERGADPSILYDKVSLHTALGNNWHSMFTHHFIATKTHEVNMQTSGGYTALMTACSKDYTDVVEKLLHHGASVHATNDRTGETALFHCTSPSCARLLLQAGADANKQNISGESPAIYTSNSDVVRELVEAGTSINFQDAMGQTLLIHNVIVTDYLLTEFLLTTADPNIVDYDNHTALSLASRAGNIPMMSLLLQHGADCNIGSSSLIEAYTNGHVDAVEFLLNHQRCNPNQTNTFGETLLIIAAQSGVVYKDRVLDMLKARHDVDVNAGDEHGRSLLHLAAAHKPYLLTHVAFLLSNGADIAKTDAYGRTILHDWEPRSDSLVQLALRQLLKMHIDVNQQDYNGHTAMHLAVMQSDGERRRIKIRELLKFGADLCVKDKNGLTAYHLATHDVQLFHMLLKHAPQHFQGDALSLMHAMSGWFETEHEIFQLLPDGNDSVARVLAHTEMDFPAASNQTNVTFHETKSPSDLSEWTRNMADHLCSAGHHQVFTLLLQQGVLCSFPEAKMAEMQEKAMTVMSLFKDIASDLAKVDKMLEFTPYVSGSCNEGTKVLLPDEMDMLCVLHNFTQLSCTKGDPCPSFIAISRKLSGKFHRFCRENHSRPKAVDFFMDQTRVFQHFYYHFGKALQNQELWQKYPKLYRIQTDDMSHSNQSITDLHLVWHGEHFPFLEFSVDVVPAFNTGGWLPKHVLDHPLIHRNGILAIPKFRVEHVQRSVDLPAQFQASFERSEADLFHIMPVELKQAYMLAKIIKSMLPKIEHLHAGMFVSSYLMKTCTFKIFQDHPEYHERLDRFIRSNELSASLTQQPYGPQPLAPVADIIHWCKQIFIRLEQAMAARTLDSFFLPGYNLLGHKIYQENYRPRLMAQICRTMLHDPATDPQAWKQLAEAQPWKIADVDDWNRVEIEDEDLCTCRNYLCTKTHKSRVK